MRIDIIYRLCSADQYLLKTRISGIRYVFAISAPVRACSVPNDIAKSFRFYLERAGMTHSDHKS